MVTAQKFFCKNKPMKINEYNFKANALLCTLLKFCNRLCIIDKLKNNC